MSKPNPTRMSKIIYGESGKCDRCKQEFNKTLMIRGYHFYPRLCKNCWKRDVLKCSGCDSILAHITVKHLGLHITPSDEPVGFFCQECTDKINNTLT